MRHIIWFTFLVAAFLLMQSCQKNDVDAPSFTVTTAKTQYKVGEPVLFNFSGNPNMITFFSGEPGKRYDYIGRDRAEGTPSLVFTSLLANGTQPNSLAIMVSDNFAGNGANEGETAANIAAATWIDITARATLSTGEATTSGPIDLSDFAARDKPVYIAFRYTGTPNSIQNKWTITNLVLTHTLPDGTTYTIANLSNAVINNYGVSTTFSPGWVQAKVANTFGWVISAGSQLVITGAATELEATEAAEAWTYCGTIDLRRVSPDLGRPIKNITTRLPSYEYVYTTPGTYTATFQGINNVELDKAETINAIQVEITP